MCQLDVQSSLLFPHPSPPFFSDTCPRLTMRLTTRVNWHTNLDRFFTHQATCSTSSPTSLAPAAAAGGAAGGSHDGGKVTALHNPPPRHSTALIVLQHASGASKTWGSPNGDSERPKAVAIGPLRASLRPWGVMQWHQLCRSQWNAPLQLPAIPSRSPQAPEGAAEHASVSKIIHVV